MDLALGPSGLLKSCYSSNCKLALLGQLIKCNCRKQVRISNGTVRDSSLLPKPSNQKTAMTTDLVILDWARQQTAENYNSPYQPSK